MKYVDEYRDPNLAERLVAHIRAISTQPITLMEVCGTHTVALFRNGIPALLPRHISLLSGPGCPVCVTAVADIDKALFLSQLPGTTITTFGDLLRVPGSCTSLLKQRSEGADVRIVYSAYDALQVARENPARQVVFLGVGFETTAPTVAAVIKRAKVEGVGNFSVLSMHKILPPALQALLSSEELKLSGFICPGHVSTVIGTAAYESVARSFHIPCVVAGFEPLDLLQTIALLVEQIEHGRAEVQIQYLRAVSPQGNPRARALMDEVFTVKDSVWRGFGTLPLSGQRLSAAYEEFDSELRFQVPPLEGREPAGCICGDILRGTKRPLDCGLFRKVCSPDNPVGACMVSSEGTCAAYYKYSN